MKVDAVKEFTTGIHTRDGLVDMELPYRSVEVFFVRQALLKLDLRISTYKCFTFQVGVRQIILAVSYRAELLEKEMKAQEERVCTANSKC